MDKALLLVALGGVAWLLGGTYYGASFSDPFMLGLVLIALGFATASYAAERSRGLGVVGFALAMVGIVMFLGEGLFRLNTLARMGSHAFAVALVVLATALLVRNGARLPIYRVGLGVALLAAVLWVVADMDGGTAWQPGNALALVGLSWAAWRPRLPT